MTDAGGDGRSRPGTLIVKVGGGARMNLDGIAEDIAGFPDPVVIVHGANALRDDLASRLGLEKRILTSVSGYASVYSDDAAIELLMLAYAGLQNKRLVECLQRHGRNAIGLSGLDGQVVRGTRNRGVRVRDGSRTLLVRDRSGKPSELNASLLALLLDHGYTPVLTMPLIDEEGRAINGENDDVVALLHRVLQARRIVQLIEAPGLLRDPAVPESVVDRLSPADVAALEEGATGRFRRKLLALARIFEDGSPVVSIADGRARHPVADALAGRGTTISRPAATPGAPS